MIPLRRIDPEITQFGRTNHQLDSALECYTGPAKQPGRQGI